MLQIVPGDDPLDVHVTVATTPHCNGGPPTRHPPYSTYTTGNYEGIWDIQEAFKKPEPRPAEPKAVNFSVRLLNKSNETSSAEPSSSNAIKVIKTSPRQPDEDQGIYDNLYLLNEENRVKTLSNKVPPRPPVPVFHTLTPKSSPQLGQKRSGAAPRPKVTFAPVDEIIKDQRSSDVTVSTVTSTVTTSGLPPRAPPKATTEPQNIPSQSLSQSSEAKGKIPISCVSSVRSEEPVDKGLGKPTRLEKKSNFERSSSASSSSDEPPPLPDTPPPPLNQTIKGRKTDQSAASKATTGGIIEVPTSADNRVLMPGVSDDSTSANAPKSPSIPDKPPTSPAKPPTSPNQSTTDAERAPPVPKRIKITTLSPLRHAPDHSPSNRGSLEVRLRVRTPRHSLEGATVSSPQEGATDQADSGREDSPVDEELSVAIPAPPVQDNGNSDERLYDQVTIEKIATPLVSSHSNTIVS